MLSSIPVWMCHSLFNHSPTEWHLVSKFWILQTELWKFVYRLLCGHSFSLLWDRCPGVWPLGHTVSLCLVFKETAELSFPEKLHHFILPLATHERAGLSRSSSTFDIATILYFGCSNRCVLILHHDFNFNFPESQPC